MRDRSIVSSIFISLLCLLITVPAFSKINKKEVRTKIAKISVPFIKNEGQVNKQVSFYAHTFGGTVFVTRSGKLVYSLPKITHTNDKKQKIQGWVISESLIGSKVKEIKGQDKSITKVNYFVGKNRNWKRAIVTYNKISLGEIYKGIELELKAYGNDVEKIFKIAKGADVGRIVLSVSGAKGIKVSKDGSLIVKTPLGDISFTKPIAYQELKGKRRYIKVSYELKGKDRYGFKVGEYDKKRELIIDPLLASTYLGGSDYDWATAIAIDSTGNVYVAGSTRSLDFPTTLGAYNATNSGYGDAFISKLDGNLTTLLASTYLGGSDDEEANAIAIDSTGDVYVAGGTDSTDFPTTLGAYNATNSGYGDAFISKLDGNLTTLLASTYLGGSDDDIANAIAIDSAGDIYVAGSTRSLDFPTTLGAYNATNSGYEDTFISKLDGNLTTLLASTYLGGSDDEEANAIAIDSTGDVYVAGYTDSTDFPTTLGAYDTVFSGNATLWIGDAFISKLDGNLTTLLASTYLGGSDDEEANAIAIDSTGDVYVAGYTDSTDFPTTLGAYDYYLGNAFISKLDGNLTTILASTYCGSYTYEATALALDSVGNVYVAGWGSKFYGNYADVFISKLDGNLTTLLASTYLGGSNWDEATAIALDSAGDVYVAGYTDSTDFPTTLGAYNTTYSGYCDAFISKLDSDLSIGVYTPSTTTSTSTTPTTTPTTSTSSSSGGGGGGCSLNPNVNGVGISFPLLIIACFLWTVRDKRRRKMKN